jgi:hypothetical protein
MEELAFIHLALVDELNWQSVSYTGSDSDNNSSNVALAVQEQPEIEVEDDRDRPSIYPTLYF